MNQIITTLAIAFNILWCVEQEFCYFRVYCSYSEYFFVHPILSHCHFHTDSYSVVKFYCSRLTNSYSEVQTRLFLLSRPHQCATRKLKFHWFVDLVLFSWYDIWLGSIMTTEYTDFLPTCKLRCGLICRYLFSSSTIWIQKIKNAEI